MVRVLTTILLAGAVLGGIWTLPLKIFQWAILLVIGAGLMEYTQLVFQDPKTKIFTVILGMFIAALMTWSPTPELMLGGLILAIFIAFLWGMTHLQPLGEATHRVGLIVLGICYLALTLPFWSRIMEAGREWVMLLLFPAALTDTFGFLVGKSIGRHKLAPNISPNKTWEGFIGGLLGGGLFGTWLAYKLFFENFPVSYPTLLIIGLIISFFAAMGDLVESLIKRSVGVKDSGKLIPGHGGALDRLDALTFVAPVFYFLRHFLL